MTPLPTPDDDTRRSRLLQTLRLQAGPRDEALDGLCRLAVLAGLGQAAWVALADETQQWIKGGHGRDEAQQPWSTEADSQPLAGTPAAQVLAAVLQAQPGGGAQPTTAASRSASAADSSSAVPSPSPAASAADAEAPSDGRVAWLRPLSVSPVAAWTGRPAWLLPLQLDGTVLGALVVLPDGAAPALPGATPTLAPPALAELAAAIETHLSHRLSMQRARLREARMRTASQAASDWLWETDAEGRLTWVSENTWLHTGLPRGEAWQAAAFEELSPPDDPEGRAAWQRYLQARERREPFADALGERDMPGGRMVMQISGIPVFDSAGRFRGYRGATRDVTREQQAKAEARRAQRLLEQALESVNAAMMISEASGRIVLSNAAWREQHGAVRAERWDELVRAEVAAGSYPDAVGREAAFTDWLLGLASPQPQHHEVRWNNRWLLISERVLADGSRVHLSIDITERKQAELAHAEQEARLRLSEARLDAVLRALPDLWFVLDADGCWRECGQPQHPLLSRPFESLVGRRFDADTPPELAERTGQALAAAHATGQVQRIEFELPTADGSLRSVEARLSPMPDGQTLYLTRDLTELLTLRRDVALMEQVLEAEVSLALLVLDATAPERPIVYANPAFERVAGLPRAEVWGQPWRVALHGARQAETATTLLEDAMRRQQPGTAVVEHDSDAGVRVQEWHLLPVRDSDEQVTHFIVVLRDVTEQVRAAEKLRVSEELYRSVAAAISDGLVVVSLDGRTAAVNPAACRILGVPADALVGRGPPFPFTLLSNDLRPLPSEALPVRQVLQGGAAITDRTMALRRADGTVRRLSVSVQPLRLHPEQAVYAAVATFRDVTETLQAQQELAISEERWKFALEGADAGVWDWDLETNRLFLSPRWKQLMGYGEQEIGDTAAEWLAQLHPDDRAPVLQTFDRYVRGELPQFHTVGRMRHRDGSWRWVLNRGHVVARRPDGQPQRLVGTLADITQQRQAEEALRHRQAAELASRAKSEFLSRMSHEIRTPLNAVLGFAQLLRMARPDGPQAAYVEHILRAGQHLLALVNDVLDLQRVEEGRLALTLKPLRLERAGRDAIELLTPQARAHEVRLVDGLSGSVTVQADEQRLRQVLLNIGSNGIKYNRRGGQVRWSLQATEGEDLAALIIEDDGPGLTPEQLGRLFQPFERLGRETSNIEGTGLGLIIARKLAEEMGGSLTVSSQPGQGTRVRIEMPTLAQPGVDGGESAAEPADPMIPSPAPAQRADDRMRVLYVEDNRINALLFEQAFGGLPGIELRVAEDGRQALELVAHWTPDVLVLDAHLPGMTGFEALDALRALPGLQQAPAYMCSADAMPEDLARARDAGFAGYWTKPIDIQQVLGELGALRDTLPQRRSAPHS